MKTGLHRLGMALTASVLLGACSGGASSPSAGVSPAPAPAPTTTPGITLLAGQIGGEGNIDGNGAAARFNQPLDLAVDPAGNVYVADALNFTVRKISPAGLVSTLAGKPGVAESTDGDLASARFSAPRSVAVDTTGNVYVADGSTVRRITPAGQVSTVARGQDGTLNEALLSGPIVLTTDAGGNLYVGDVYTRNIRKMSPAGVMSTLAGQAYGHCTYIFGQPNCVAVDGSAEQAGFVKPAGLAIDTTGNVYVADAKAIRKISTNGQVSTLSSASDSATITELSGLTIDSGGNLYTLDIGLNSRLLKFTPAGVMSIVTAANTSDFTGYKRLFINPAGTLYLVDSMGVVSTLSLGKSLQTLAGTKASTGSADGNGAAARFYLTLSQVSSSALDGAGNLYIADQNNYTIRKISAGGDVTTLAGSAGQAGYADGMASAARFTAPRGIVADASGNLFIADGVLVRKITPAGNVTTLAGNAGKWGDTDGVGSAASFYDLNGISLDGQGNLLVTTSSAIRKITPDLRVSTLAGMAMPSYSDSAFGNVDGNASQARFNHPRGIVADSAGNIYVADSDNHTIRKITAAGSVTTLAGVATQAGAADGLGNAARFNLPIGLSLDARGNLFVTDSGNHSVRQLSSDGRVSTVAGQAGKIGVSLGALPGTLAAPSALASGNGVLYVSTANGIVKIQL